jgi:hypothetical protein
LRKSKSEIIIHPALKPDKYNAVSGINNIFGNVIPVKAKKLRRVGLNRGN